MRNRKGEESSRAIGDHYENLAVDYLKKAGYSIVERNFHCRQGEIDIVAREEHYLCFIEVKYRATGNFGKAAEAVSPAKQRRISRSALYYLTVNGYREDQPCRFDVIGITSDGIDLIKNAFEYRG